MHHAHILDLIRREKSKLNLLNRAQRRAGVREVEVRHLGRGRMRCDDSKVATFLFEVI